VGYAELLLDWIADVRSEKCYLPGWRATTRQRCGVSSIL
jgi:hypothetical protein